MGIRFRESIKIAPGIKLNVGKKSMGVSVGNRYGGLSYNTKTGTRARVSAPGTGLSYTKKLSSKSNSSPVSTTEYVITLKEKSKWVAFWLCLCLGFFGAHKFYEGKIKQGLLYLCTCGLFGFGWMVDTIVLLFKPNKYYI